MMVELDCEIIYWKFKINVLTDVLSMKYNKLDLLNVILVLILDCIMVTHSECDKDEEVNYSM